MSDKVFTIEELLGDQAAPEPVEKPEAPAAAFTIDELVDGQLAGGNPESQGLAKLKQGAGKMLEGMTLDSMLDRVTPDMVKDYQAGGIEGVIRGNAQRSWVPGADIVARTMLGDDFETVLDEEVNAAEALNALGDALPTPEIAPGVEMPILGEAQGALNRQAVRQPLLAWSDLDKPAHEWSPVAKAAVEAFEKDTGHKWVGQRQLAKLRTKAPGEYRKVRNRQQAAALSFGQGFAETWEGLYHLGMSQVDAVRKGQGIQHAGTTLGTMGGTMMEDWAQLVTDPGARATEDPFGMTLDLAGMGGPAGRLAGAAKVPGALRRGASVADALGEIKTARKAAQAEPVLRGGLGVAKELTKTPYDLGAGALKSLAKGKEGRIAERVRAIPSATRLERALVDTLPDAVDGFLDVSRIQRQLRTGNVEKAADAVRGLRDHSAKLEDFFGDAAKQNDAAVLRVLETDLAIKNKLSELRAEAALGDLSPGKAALLDELNKVRTIDDVARFAADEARVGMLDRDLRLLLDNQKYLDEVVKAAEKGSDLDLAQALRNARGSVDDIRARIKSESQRIDGNVQRQFERIDAQSLERIRKAAAAEADAVAKAKLPQVDRIKAANARASEMRQGVKAKLKRQATNLGEFIVRQRNKADNLVDKAEDARAAVEDVRTKMADMDAMRAQKRSGKFSKAEAKRFSRFESKLREKEARRSELESKVALTEDSLAKAQRVVDNWHKLEAEELSLVKRRTDDMVADAAAKTEDAIQRARARRKRVEDVEADHVRKRKEAVREQANSQKAKTLGDLEARLKSLENLDGNRKFSYADREAIKAAMLRDSAKATEALQDIANVQKLLSDPNALKANGAWLELDGKVLGTADAAAHALAELNAGKTVSQIFDSVAVKGDDLQAMAVLDQAREALRLSSEFDHGLMQHGVVSPARFAANLGRNLLTLTNPRHAEEFTSAKVAKAPEIALLERSNLLSQLDLIRDVSRLPGVVVDNTDFRVLGSGRSSSGVPLYKKQNVRGEQLEVGRLPTPEGNIAMVRVPATQMSTADLRFNKYGDLAGHWVTRDTFDGLQKFVGYRGDFLSKWGGLVKRIKVVDNLSSLVNMNLGNIASMAWDRIPPTELVKALRHMGGKGSEVDKMFTKHMRYEGIYEGASSHHLTGLAESEKLSHLNMDAALREAKSGLGGYMGMALEGGDKLSKNFNGFGGAVRHTWRVTDQAFRLATARALFERGAKQRGYNTRTPEGMRQALADAELVESAKRNTLRDTLDYAEVPVGPRVAGRGVYEWAADTGFAPFIIYPLKAGGLWAQRFAESPRKLRAMELAGEAEWQSVPEFEREKRLEAQLPGEVGEKGFIGNTSVNLTPINPVAFLPVEAYRGLSGMATGEAPLPMLAQPLAEALTGETHFGQKLWDENDSELHKLSHGTLHLLLAYGASPSMQKFLPQVGLERQGILERAWQDPVVDERTLEELELKHAVGRMFLSYDVQAGDKSFARLMKVGRRYRMQARQAQKRLGRTGNMDAYERDMRRLDMGLAKDVGEVVSILANR